jgi:4-amino-4-deoxy-L-arabinose transferase-like glycosyltransferase
LDTTHYCVEADGVNIPSIARYQRQLAAVMYKQRNIKFSSYSILIFLCFLCLLFNYFTINKEDYWADETVLYNIAKLPSLRAIWEYLKGDLHPPVYYIFLYYMCKLSEPIGMELRWFSTFWGIAGLIGLYFWVRRSFGKTSAAIAALFLCINPFYLYYCREMRMYMVMCALLWWSCGFLVLASQTNKKVLWILSALLSALACLTHYFALFFIISEIAALIIVIRVQKKKELLNGLKWFVYAFLFFILPFTGLTIQQIVNNREKIAWLQSPRWYALPKCYVEAFLTFSASYYRPDLDVLWFCLPPALLAVMVFYYFRSLKREMSPHGNPPALFQSFPGILLLTTTFLTTTLMFFTSYSPVKSFLEYRYVIFSLGPFLGLLACLIYNYPRVWLRKISLIIILSLMIVGNLVIITHKEKPGWKKIVGVMDKALKKDDILVVIPPYFCSGYQYYSSQKHPVVTFEDLILQSKPAQSRIYLLIYKDTANEEPYYPWLTLEFMNRMFKRTRLLDETWYWFVRYDNIDWTLLKKWFHARRTWHRQEVLSRNPIVFLGAEDIDGKGSFSNSPLELAPNYEVFRRLHTPPAKIPLNQTIPPGDYTIQISTGVGFFPKQFVSISLIINGREIKRWHLRKDHNYIMESRFKQDRLDGKLEIILDGTAYRPIDFVPHSKDKRKLMTKFFWLAIFKNEDKPAS